jgi:hypothetical protein
VFGLRRREVITALGGVAAWPLAGRAQQMKILRVCQASAQPRTAPFQVAFEKRMAEYRP